MQLLFFFEHDPPLIGLHVNLITQNCLSITCCTYILFINPKVNLISDESDRSKEKRKKVRVVTRLQRAGGS